MKHSSAFLLILVLLSCSSTEEIENNVTLEYSIKEHIKSECLDRCTERDVLIVEDHSDEYYESYKIFISRIKFKEFSNLPLAIGEYNDKAIFYYCRNDNFCRIDKFPNVKISDESEIIGFIKKKGFYNPDLNVTDYPIPSYYSRNKETEEVVYVAARIYDRIKRIELRSRSRLDEKK